MHILIVSAEYVPNVTSGVNRLKFLARVLLENGVTVSVLTADPKLYNMSVPANDSVEENLIRTGWLSHGLQRFLSTRYFPIFNKISIPDKYFHWRRGAMKAGKKLAAQKPFDLIFTSYPGYTNLEVAYGLSQYANVPLLVDFRDPPLLALEGEDTKQNRQLQIVGQTCKRAVGYTAATESTARALRRRFLDSSKLMTVIPNGFDKSLLDSVVREPKEEPANIYTIMHIGSFYPEGRDIVRVVTALDDYLQKGVVSVSGFSTIRLVLIGELPPSKMLAAARNAAKVLELIVEPPCSNLEALRRAYNSQALLLLQGVEFDAQVPAKAYEYLALQLPIWAVVGPNSESKKLLQKYPENVVFADYSLPEQIANSVEVLLAKTAVEGNYQELSREYNSTLFIQPINEAVRSQKALDN